MRRQFARGCRAPRSFVIIIGSEHVFKRLALDKLHDEINQGIVFGELAYLYDVRMRETRRRLGLAPQPLHQRMPPHRAERIGCGYGFDGYRFVRFGIYRLVDDAASAASEFGDDPITPNRFH